MCHRSRAIILRWNLLLRLCLGDYSTRFCNSKLYICLSQIFLVILTRDHLNRGLAKGCSNLGFMTDILWISDFHQQLGIILSKGMNWVQTYSGIIAKLVITCFDKREKTFYFLNSLSNIYFYMHIRKSNTTVPAPITARIKKRLDLRYYKDHLPWHRLCKDTQWFKRRKCGRKGRLR